jgi:hypothetical protein
MTTPKTCNNCRHSVSETSGDGWIDPFVDHDYCDKGKWEHEPKPADVALGCPLYETKAHD